LELGDHVRALAAEARVLLDVEDDVEIAGGAAVEPLLALAGEAQPRTLFDAGRDGHLERALLLDPPLAAAALAGVGDHRAAAAALRAGAGDGEEALREAHLADAAAGVAGGGRAGAGAAAALALLADLEARYLQRVGGAEGGLLERQLEVV